MKRIVYIFLLLSFLLLYSCSGLDNGSENGKGDEEIEDEEGSGDEGTETPEEPDTPIQNTPNLIYGETAFPALVYREGELSSVISMLYGVQSAINESASMKPPVFLDSGAMKFTHEIVVGDTAREISRVAKEELLRVVDEKRDELLKEGEDAEVTGYLIYSDGSSVAVVWTDDSISELALEHFTENYTTEQKLVLEPGFSDFDVVSMAEYLDERDERIKSEAWAALSEALPEEYREGILTELKALYSLYSPDMIVWLANLFDPETGGFYCSNSARDNAGFLPDIESTWYGYGYIGGLGAAEMYGNKWQNAVPEWAKERTAQWVYNLQDEDGYFYHPQWPKSYIEANGFYSRISRDYNTGRTLLRELGWTPKYASAYGSGELTAPLGASSVAAVSKVVSTSTTLPFLASDEAFAEYLVSLEKQVDGVSDAQRAYKFYEFGNTFQSITGLMSDNMKDQLEAFFDKHQNPENGLWSEGYHYDSTNGIHKIAAVYNYMGKELKHIDKIVESTITVLKFDIKTKPMRYVVDGYNAWSAFPYIYTNIRKYSSGTAEEREARCLEIKTRVFEEAVDMIHISTENLKNFAYPDGSFGYSRNTVGSGGTAQGCPSAVPGTREGNLDGTGIAMSSLPTCIFGALELTKYKIPMFTERERVLYVKILEEIDARYQASIEK